MSHQVIRLHVDAAQRAESMYLTVPFELAPGVESFEVNLGYDRSNGARVDIGCEGPRGWRGWSGGARRRFVVGRAASTWGYVSGEIEDGEWRIVLGLHVVPAAGADLTIRIHSPGGRVLPDPEPDPPIERAGWGRTDLPATSGLRWYACDFHAHSLHSDGSQSVGQLARLAAAAGLDVLAVTDHNTVSHHEQLAEAAAAHGVTLIPGQEVTTARGHANAYGAIPWIDFRAHPREWVARIEQSQGILSINHPVSGDCSWQWLLDTRPSHAEILHSSWLARPDDTSAWAWWNAWGDAIPLGGSDFHYPESGIQPGTPTTWIAAEDPSAEAILDGMRKGHVALAGAPTGTALVRVGDEITAVGAAGLTLCDNEGRRAVVIDDRATWRAPHDRRYHLETAHRQIIALIGNGHDAPPRTDWPTQPSHTDQTGASR